VLLRRQWLAVAVTAILISSIATLARFDQTAAVGQRLLGAAAIFSICAVIWTIILYVMIRSGLLASIFLFLVVNAIVAFPPSLDLSDWFAARSWLGAAMVVAVARYAFTTSRAHGTRHCEELVAR